MDATRDIPKDLKVLERDGFVEVAFLGTSTVDDFKRQADAASALCRERKSPRLLVDLTRIDFLPTMMERYDLALHAVKASAGLKVALHVRPTFLDPNKFGIVVAQNRGLQVNVFVDRQPCLEWLLAAAPATGDATPA